MKPNILTIIILIIILIFISIIRYINNKDKLNSYKPVITVKNLEDFRKHFLLNNPNENGTDPTGGLVDYSFMFQKKDGKILPNVNGDTSWQNINKNTPLLEDNKDGFSIHVDKKLVNGVVGAPRLISKKLFKGGLFIFDIEHVPYGCAVWPAIWFNGFIGGKDQFHQNPSDKSYNDNMEKLAKTLETHSCNEETTFLDKPEKNLSYFLQKDVYPSSWPSGGEFDFLEQTNFATNNTISIHTGPSCEMVDGYDNEYVSLPTTEASYENGKFRSGCGVTYWPNIYDENSGFGPYSGCKNDSSKIGELGGDKTTTSNGQNRYNCPINSAVNSGNVQISAPFGSFGKPFNVNKGGVYALHWVPKEVINIWWFPRDLYSENYLKKDSGPLSKNPEPKNWNPEMKPDIKGSQNYYEKNKVLIASYILNNENAITSGCNFNYQGIIINITLGGGWGGAVMPKYCSVSNKSEANDYISKCISADAEQATLNGDGIDYNNGCYDGAFSEYGRGALEKPVFYSEAYFKIRNISVFQSKEDDNVW